MDISEMVNGLFNKDDNAAYKCLRELVSVSELDNGVYHFFDTFAEMIDTIILTFVQGGCS